MRGPGLADCPRPGPGQPCVEECVRSETQREMSPGEVADLVCRALGRTQQVLAATELRGGGFAAVWRVDLDGGRTVVFKAAPPPGVRLLSYETGLLAVESHYFQRVRREVPGVPVPEVLHYEIDPDQSRGGDWMVMTFLPGTVLCELQQTAPPQELARVRRDLGAALARLHTLEGPEFGYPGEGRRRGGSWRAVFLGIVADLLDDADRLGSVLPVPADEILRVFDRASPVLDEVRSPRLVHFDLWDGNILARQGSSSGLRLSGLVDGERCLYGDPLVDFVSSDLFGALETQPEHPVLTGYAETAGWTEPLTEAARARIRLYRAWLYLVMNVEIPTRAGIDAEQRRHRAELLTGALAAVAGR